MKENYHGVFSSLERIHFLILKSIVSDIVALEGFQFELQEQNYFTDPKELGLLEGDTSLTCEWNIHKNSIWIRANTLYIELCSKTITTIPP